MNFMI